VNAPAQAVIGHAWACLFRSLAACRPFPVCALAVRPHRRPSRLRQISSAAT